MKTGAQSRHKESWPYFVGLGRQEASSFVFVGSFNLVAVGR